MERMTGLQRPRTGRWHLKHGCKNAISSTIANLDLLSRRSGETAGRISPLTFTRPHGLTAPTPHTHKLHNPHFISYARRGHLLQRVPTGRSGRPCRTRPPVGPQAWPERTARHGKLHCPGLHFVGLLPLATTAAYFQAGPPHPHRSSRHRRVSPPPWRRLSRHSKPASRLSTHAL